MGEQFPKRVEVVTFPSIESALFATSAEHERLSREVPGIGIARIIVKDLTDNTTFDTGQSKHESPINLASLGKIPFAIESLRQAKKTNIEPGYTRIAVPLSDLSDGDPLHQVMKDTAEVSRLSIQRARDGMLSMPLSSAIELTLGVSSNDSLLGIGAWLRDLKKSQVPIREGENNDEYIDRLKEVVANDVESMAHNLIKKHTPSKEPMWSTRNSTRSKKNNLHNTGGLSEAMAMLECIVTSTELVGQVGQDGLMILRTAFQKPSGHPLEPRDGILANAYTKYGLWGNNEKGDFGALVF